MNIDTRTKPYVRTYITPEDLDDGRTVFHVSIAGVRTTPAFGTLEAAKREVFRALHAADAEQVEEWEPQYDSLFGFKSGMPCGYVGRTA